MSTPGTGSESPSDSPLVEPTTASLPTVPRETLDTARILNETAAIPVVAPRQEFTAPSPTELAEEEKVALSGWNVLSIVSVVLAAAISPLAVVFGYLAVGQIRRSAQRGEGLAWVAVALGWVWTVSYVVAGVVVALTWIQIS